MNEGGHSRPFTCFTPDAPLSAATIRGRLRFHDRLLQGSRGAAYARDPIGSSGCRASRADRRAVLSRHVFYLNMSEAASGAGAARRHRGGHRRLTVHAATKAAPHATGVSYDYVDGGSAGAGSAVYASAHGGAGAALRRWLGYVPGVPLPPPPHPPPDARVAHMNVIRDPVSGSRGSWGPVRTRPRRGEHAVDERHATLMRTETLVTTSADLMDPVPIAWTLAAGLWLGA